MEGEQIEFGMHPKAIVPGKKFRVTLSLPPELSKEIESQIKGLGKAIAWINVTGIDWMNAVLSDAAKPETVKEVERLYAEYRKRETGET